jgi:Domain of unknown function (DUF1707)
MALRVGDAEREAAVERLSRHAAAGRLTVAELEERVERAQRAVYARDLGVLEADLPAPAARRSPQAVLPALAVLLAAVALTAAVGHPPLFILAVFLWRGRYSRMKRTVAVTEPWSSVLP